LEKKEKGDDNMSDITIVTERNVLVSSKFPSFTYEFKTRQPLEVKEEHLDKFPGWGSEDCMFKTVTGVKEKKKKEVKEEDDK
jgi:hypothetical protein